MLDPLLPHLRFRRQVFGKAALDQIGLDRRVHHDLHQHPFHSCPAGVDVTLSAVATWTENASVCRNAGLTTAGYGSVVISVVRRILE
ncbi:hypothetical protein [Methyloversatilis discipulorum]|uniref:hypothetical protein n=1 Tax=Methyloversatilis discipulorum TaxID=1119528 RepID=UPI001A5E260B|nr:hypothetical protein [Methyloversatilis discipulorum]MBL8469096.1 hypothetical protein [Methyloversatilis discipulorum]